MTKKKTSSSKRKFPSSWSPTTIAVFYALMCDMCYADACFVEQNWMSEKSAWDGEFNPLGKPERWIRYMAPMADQLGFNRLTSLRARKKIVKDPTDWFPAAANPHMVLQYIAATGQGEVSYARDGRIRVKLSHSPSEVSKWLIAHGFKHTGPLVVERDEGFDQKSGDWRAT